MSAYLKPGERTDVKIARMAPADRKEALDLWRRVSAFGDAVGWADGFRRLLGGPPAAAG